MSGVSEASRLFSLIPPAEISSTSPSTVPCFRMGRLACRTDQRGLGIGKLLLGCAVDRCLKARQQVAAYALLVDAKDDVAKAFYEHFGFKTFQDAPLTLYLPLGR